MKGSTALNRGLVKRPNHPTKKAQPVVAGFHTGHKMTRHKMAGKKPALLAFHGQMWSYLMKHDGKLYMVVTR